MGDVAPDAGGRGCVRHRQHLQLIAADLAFHSQLSPGTSADLLGEDAFGHPKVSLHLLSGKYGSSRIKRTHGLNTRHLYVYFVPFYLSRSYWLLPTASTSCTFTMRLRRRKESAKASAAWSRTTPFLREFTLIQPLPPSHLPEVTLCEFKWQTTRRIMTVVTIVAKCVKSLQLPGRFLFPSIGIQPTKRSYALLSLLQVV